MLDTFNRPNETPLGPPYGFSLVSVQDTNLTSHQAVNPGTNPNYIYFSGSLMADGRVAIVFGNSWVEQGGVRMRWSENQGDPFVSGDRAGYIAYYSNVEDQPIVQLFRDVGVAIAAQVVLSSALVAGDRLELECRGQTIELWTQRTGGPRLLQSSATDSTYSEGKTGFVLHNNEAINAFEFTPFGDVGSFESRHGGRGLIW